MNTPRMPERFLRQVWQHQRFSAGNLHTSDGRRVEILFPGTSNADGGPDFTGACIRIGNVTFHGDVELHQNTQEWESHLHDTDQHYNKVILHVVLTADPLAPPSRTESKRLLPLLVLHPYLDDTLRATWMRAIYDARSEQRKVLTCYALNDRIPADVIRQWIHRLAHERIEMKIRRHEERLKELVDEQKMIIREPYPRYYGSPDEIPLPTKEYARRDFASRLLWEQLLYEAIMEGLGYSKNAESFLLLAQSMRLSILRQNGLSDTTTVMALLFGAAGLLPLERTVVEKNARMYLRSLRRQWRELRKAHKGRLLQPGDWMFFRLRPSNFPTARLASMCFLLPKLFEDGGLRTVIALFKDEALSSKQRLGSCQRLFLFKPDEFWHRHYRFDQATGATGISLGIERVNDLVVNGLLPVVLLYARLFKDGTIRENAHNVFKSLPSLQANSITRLFDRQLLKEKLRLMSALEQQGAIHLFKFFCMPGRCSECEIGKRLRLGE